MPGIHTGKQLSVIEVDAVSKVPFSPGQLIIQDNGDTYYDKTSGTTAENGRTAISSGGSSSADLAFNIKGVIHSSSTMPTSPTVGDTYIFTDTQSMNGESSLNWLTKTWTSFPADFDSCTITSSTSATYTKALRIENYQGDPQGLIALAAAERLIIPLSDGTEIYAIAAAKPAEQEENGKPVTYILLSPVSTTTAIVDGTITSTISISNYFPLGSSDKAGVSLKTAVYNGDLIRYTGKYWQVIGRGGEVTFDSHKSISIDSADDLNSGVLVNPYSFGAQYITIGYTGITSDYYVPANVQRISASSATAGVSIANIYGHDQLYVDGKSGGLLVGTIRSARSVTGFDNYLAGKDNLELSSVGKVIDNQAAISANACSRIINCNIKQVEDVSEMSGCSLLNISSLCLWKNTSLSSVTVSNLLNTGSTDNSINGLSKYPTTPNKPTVLGTPPNITYIGIGSTCKVLHTASKWETGLTTYTNYPCRTYIDVPYMTADHFPYVIFDSVALASGVFDGAPVETVENKLYIYAKSVPTFDFQIDFKAVV